MYDDPQNPKPFDDQQFDPLKRNGNTGVVGPDALGALAPQQGQYDRNQFRDAWMNSGIQNTAGAADFVKQHQGDFGAGVSIGGSKGDQFVLPGNEGTIDAVFGAGAGGNLRGPQWTGTGQYSPAAQAASSGASGAQSFGSGGGQLDGAFRDALLKAMNGANTPYDPTAPQNAAQQNAYNVQQERSGQRQREALAERAAFNGLNSGGAGSGAFETGIQGIGEQTGQNEAAFAGNLAQQDYQAKRQDLAHALDLANAVGARQEAAALQMQLAQLDNQYRYSALGQQQGQFEDQMAYNWNDWLGNQNRASLLLGMNG